MFFLQIFNQCSYFYDLLRIKTYCRFIQNNHLWISHNSLCQPHSLAVTLGQVFDQTISHVRYFYHIHYFFYHRCFFIFGNFLKICHKFHIFQNGHIEIERWLFRQVTNTFFCLFRLIQYIMSINSNRTFCRCNVSCDHIHCS